MAATEKSESKNNSGAAKIHNADDFSNYVHAVTIPMKVVMAAIVVFFAGAIAYCIFGQVPDQVSAPVISDADGVVCYVTSSDRADIRPGNALEVDGETHSIESVSTDAITVDESIDAYARQIGGLSIGDSVYVITVDGDVSAGVYLGTITKGYLHPLEVLLES